MPDHSFRREIFPNIQSKPPLTQLEAIASCPVVLTCIEMVICYELFMYRLGLNKGTGNKGDSIR